MRFILLGIAAITVIAGCESKPRAPELSNEAIFQDTNLGLRFIAPEGWAMYARTNPPAGVVSKPTRIVAYIRTTVDGRGDLELYIADYPANQTLLEYLKEHPIGPDKWQEKGPPTEVNLTSATAKLHSLNTGPQGKWVRDVWEIRRKGDRVFLFICSAMTSDRGVRDQARRAVESVTFQLD